MCVVLAAIPAWMVMTAMVVSVAASAASAAMSIQGQRQQQKAQIEYQTRLADANKRQMEQNRDLATKAFLDQANAANRQLAETREATAAANFDQSRKGAEARGAALASASEAGVYGVSLDSLLSDFHRQEAMFMARNEQNLLMKQQQTATQIQGYQSEAAARTQRVQPYQPSPVAPVDYVGPALQVVQSGTNTVMNYNTATKGAK